MNWENIADEDGSSKQHGYWLEEMLTSYPMNDSRVTFEPSLFHCSLWHNGINWLDYY